jgi:DNA topoisomerase-6 subunit B
MAMLKSTKSTTLKNFLKNEFVRVGDKIAEDVLLRAGFSGEEDPRRLGREEAAKLLEAFRSTDFLPPPTDCLSPIGDRMIVKSLMTEYSPEFVYAVTRKPKVYSGHPFLVEVGIAYGGELKSDDKIILLRYANKIPLLYQQGGCALTKAVENVNWKNYGLNQSKDELPSGPAVILIHLASTNIPYTSESKEAIAAIPEIVDEARLALQEAGRKMKEYIERKGRAQKKKKKEEILNKILPLLASKVCEVLEKDPLEVDKIVARIMGYVYLERIVSETNGVKEVTLLISNFSRAMREFRVYEMCEGEVEAEDAKISSSAYKTLSWRISIKPGQEKILKYRVRGKILNQKPLIEGVEPEIVLGAEIAVV